MTVVLAAEVHRNVGITIAVLVVLALAVYGLVTARQGAPAVGAELELAPNRKPYHPDEVLEGRKLDQSLLWAVIFLAIIGIGLPLYWLFEPNRQAGAAEGAFEAAAKRGAGLFASSAEGGFGCADCHGPGGIGGSANYTLTDPDTGTPVKVVSWRAPSLNDALLRYTRDDVLEILTYGRPFSPMPAWGLEGGGPMNDQQLTDLVAYLETITITPEEAQQLPTALDENGQPLLDGEQLFLNYCARCHTKGWSYREQGSDIVPGTAEVGRPEEFVQGSGAFGPALIDGVTVRRFPSFDDHVAFVKNGCSPGLVYGVQGQCKSGQMPGFGRKPDPDELVGPVLTDAQIEAIVRYERSL